jgi:hypothetical protein
MRIKPLDIGVESITRWQPEDEVHLPRETGLRPAFLPHYRPLDEILRRPSLDERLPRLLQPEYVRAETRELFAVRAGRESGRRRHLLEAAAACLDDDINLDHEVRRALAALLRA